MSLARKTEEQENEQGSMRLTLMNKKMNQGSMRLNRIHQREYDLRVSLFSSGGVLSRGAGILKTQKYTFQDPVHSGLKFQTKICSQSPSKLAMIERVRSWKVRE